MSEIAFSSFTLNGVDAQKFLQGQVTLNVEKLAEGETRYTGICNLKGRLQFGLWLKKSILKVLKLLQQQTKQKNLLNILESLGPFLK